MSAITATWLDNNNPSWTQYVVDISTWNGFAGTVTSSTTYLTNVSTVGLTTLAAYMRIGYDHRFNPGQRYVPAWLQTPPQSAPPPGTA